MLPILFLTMCFFIAPQYPVGSVMPPNCSKNIFVLPSLGRTALEASSNDRLLVALGVSTNARGFSPLPCPDVTQPCLWLQIVVSRGFHKCFAQCASRPVDGELGVSATIHYNYVRNREGNSTSAPMDSNNWGLGHNKQGA